MNGFTSVKYLGLLGDLNTPNFSGYPIGASSSTPSACSSTSREPCQGKFNVQVAACINKD